MSDNLTLEELNTFCHLYEKVAALFANRGQQLQLTRSQSRAKLDSFAGIPSMLSRFGDKPWRSTFEDVSSNEKMNFIFYSEDSESPLRTEYLPVSILLNTTKEFETWLESELVLSRKPMTASQVLLQF